MKQTVLAGLMSSVIFSSALLSSAALARDVDFPHLETVGVSQLEIEPDMAEIRVEVTVTDKDPKAAKAKSDQAVAQFIAQLQAAGVDKQHIQSANINLQPQYSYEQNRERELTGYNASREVTVTLNDLTRLNAVLDSALDEGINRINNIALKTSKQADYIAQARLAAIEDAKQKAQVLAKGFDKKLDGVWEIRYFEQMPVQPVMMRMSAKADMGAAESYQFGQVNIQDRVEVVFKLK